MLLALSCLFSLALCEGVLRLVWANPYRHELADRVVTLRMHHGLREQPINRREIDAESPTAMLRTDARSYILPSRRFEKPDATVVFLGGSTTECVALDEEQRFPALVSKLLEAQGLRVDTLNAGVSGNTTHDVLNVLLNHVNEDHPDVAVLMEAANDYGVLAQDPIYRTRSAQLVTPGAALRWPLQFLSAKSWLVGALRNYLTLGPVTRDPGGDANAKDTVTPPDEYVKRLRAFVRLSRAFGIEPVLMTQPSIAVPTPNTPRWVTARNQDLFNAELRRVASEEGVTLIDLVKHLEDTVPDFRVPGKIFYDGLHVGPEGSRVYAEYIAQRLRETVLAKRGSGAAAQHE